MYVCSGTHEGAQLSWLHAAEHIVQDLPLVCMAARWTLAIFSQQRHVIRFYDLETLQGRVAGHGHGGCLGSMAPAAALLRTRGQLDAVGEAAEGNAVATAMRRLIEGIFRIQ